VRIVSILVARDDADVVDAHIAFHLNTGVDFVIAMDTGSEDGTTDILESYASGGYLRRITERGEGAESDWRTRMAQLAATEHGAEWLISTDPDEFWWPRGESLKDVLTAMPPRYGVIQALVRNFWPRGDDATFFAERMTLRPSLLGPLDGPREPLSQALRPVYRVDPHIAIEPGDGTGRGERVPLRAWYPIEVLRFPFRGLEQAQRFVARIATGAASPRSSLEEEAVAAYRDGGFDHWYSAFDDVGLADSAADDSTVTDERLRGALRLVTPAAGSSATGSGRKSATPGEAGEPLVLRPPDVVDDASYAGECAALREVDFEPLVARIAELEARIGWLEARFWPRVRRSLARVVRR
jgi:Glycosyl transferase family 2